MRELCISGGSQKGLAYLGALSYLQENDLITLKLLKKIIGVSIGSYICACFLIGYTIDEILDYILATDIQSFKDISITDSHLAILKGQKIREWVYETLKKKINPDITMLQLYELTNVEFIVATICLEDGLVYIDYKNRPNMKLYDLIISSMNLPFVFPPYVVNNEQGIPKTYVDGGLIDNFPMQLLSSDAIGITSEKNNNQVHISELNVFSFTKKLYDIMKHHIEDLKPYTSEYVYQLKVADIEPKNKGIGNNNTINLDIDIDDKITLYMSGYNYVKNSEITKKLLHKKQIKLNHQKVLEQIRNNFLEL